MSTWVKFAPTVAETRFDDESERSQDLISSVAFSGTKGAGNVSR